MAFKTTNLTLLEKRLYAIIFLLLIIIGIVIYLWMRPSAGESFRERVPTPIALENIERYRERVSWNKKSRIVWYDTADIRRYLDIDFPRLTSKLNGRDGYKWVVGFYFMRKYKDGNPRTDFYVIPTLVDPTRKSKDSILDFADPANASAYSFKNPSERNDDNHVAFNTGHIWP